MGLLHSEQTKVHPIIDADLIYANETTLLAATGFTSEQVGMVGKATAEDSYWILRDESPVTWGKILLSPIIQYGKVVNAMGNQSGAVTLDLDDGNVITLTQTGNITFTFDNPQASGIESSFKLIITNDGSSPWTRTWPGSVDWPGGTEPTLTGTALAVDTYTFFTTNGGTIYQGFLPGADMK